MYTELAELVEAKGKTVQSITRSIVAGQMVIAFIDETFVCLGIDRGYDDGSVFQEELDLEDFGQAAIVGSGIITLEEYRQKVNELRVNRCQAREAIERRQFERLRAKFEEVK